jgi:uncharacterized membrane protein YhaH (DUF805 family)
MDYIKKLYSGRINRKDYVLDLLCLILARVLLEGVLDNVLASGDSTFIHIGILTIYLVVDTVFFVYIFSLHVRRLHDLGESGWKAFLLFIPLINLIILIRLLFAKSNVIELSRKEVLT